MADTKISGITTDVTTLASGDKFPIADVSNPGVNTYATATEIANFVVTNPPSTDVTTLASGDKFLIQDVSSSTTPSYATTAEIQTFMQAANGMPKVLSLGSQYTNSTTTGTSVTGLRFDSLVAGNYYVRWILLVQTAATGTSCSFGVNYTGSITRFSAHTLYPSAGVTAATGTWHDANNATTGQVYSYANTHTASTTTPNMGPWVGVTNANQNHLVIVETLVVVSNGGNLELYAASEVGASQMSIEVGSSAVLIRTG